ncbi:DUF4390 domain-containing protein [Aquabacterium sp. J223]|uniref:DUF4390 domain-containing protein n=1 Tax=Aquabacterium sp. J223 TaxID=2898431 RepID=UPI0021ADC678|nr:DUF4390 domain-containing protein [Aquabacterium sp. J223]UUX95930.1 DUF4390 domain-containing protein [Aquabacterium sp. J223]
MSLPPFRAADRATSHHRRSLLTALAGGWAGAVMAQGNASPPAAPPASAPGPTAPAPGTGQPLPAQPVPTPGIELRELSLLRRDGWMSLDFAVRINLSRAVDDALQRGVPVYFVAQATLTRYRWYWRDDRVARAQRTWRLAWQPLTASWRVSQMGGLQQAYATQAEALAAISRAVEWRLVEADKVDPEERHTLTFSYRLDTEQLPRPMQIGIGGQPDWALGVERSVRLE